MSTNFSLEEMEDFSEWVVKPAQADKYSKCRARYVTSKTNESFHGFLKPEMDETINDFVDVKTRGIVKKLKNEIKISSDLSRKLYGQKAYVEKLKELLDKEKKIHIDTQKRYSELVAQGGDGPLPVDDNDSEIKRLTAENKKLSEKLKQQHEEFSLWADEETARNRAEHKRAQDAFMHQDEHIHKQALRITELEHMLEQARTGAPPEPGRYDRGFSRFSPTWQQARGPPKHSKPFGVGGGAHDTESEDFIHSIDSFRDKFSEELGVANYKDDYTGAIIVEFQGRQRNGQTSLRTAAIANKPLYEKVSDDMYNIIGMPNVAYWYLIFYGPFGNYLTNMTGHPDREITERFEGEVINEDCIVFIWNRNDTPLDQQIKGILASIKTMDYSPLYNMLERVFGKDEDRKSTAAPKVVHSLNRDHDADLELALRRSMASFEFEEQQREAEGDAMYQSKQLSSQSLLSQPLPMSDEQKRGDMVRNIADMMGDLNINESSQKKYYNNWKMWEMTRLQRLYEEIRNRWLKFMDDSY